MKIVTIARNPDNSPNMVANDAAILECVTKELVTMGAEVIAIGEEEEIPDDTDIVCHMSRSHKVISRLNAAEKRGVAVINTAKAVENCSRIATMQLLEKNNIQQPFFRIIEQEEDLKELPFPAWIKRGEGWSCHKDDVCFASDVSKAKEAIAGMHKRGITSFIYVSHCKGDIIKFYGVGDSYFTYSYPDAEKTKFGLEKINGEIGHYPFDVDKMRKMVFEAAKATGLSIYGGDCIVDENGFIDLIDLNDFPSFSAVRDEAAKEIAKHIINTYISIK